MSELGLNDHHQSNVVNYMRFARYQRGQRLRGVDACFNELRDARLCDDNTFTVDEVEDMCEGLKADVRTEVEAELINTAHTNVLLLRQLFQQAEKWHLKLAADISELENRELLEQIREFEERQFSGTSDDKKPVLAPLNETGATGLLKAEIDRLQEENNTLSSRLRQTESQALQLGEEKAALVRELERVGGRGAAERALSNLPSLNTSGMDADELERQMARLRAEMEKNSGDAYGDLTDTKHELLKVRAMLELAEKELEAKVSQTTPFKNLKMMLQKKNEQLRECRRRLGKYEEDLD